MFKSLSSLVVGFPAALKCLEDSGLVYATWSVGTDGTVRTRLLNGSADAEIGRT